MHVAAFKAAEQEGEWGTAPGRASSTAHLDDTLVVHVATSAAILRSSAGAHVARYVQKPSAYAAHSGESGRGTEPPLDDVELEPEDDEDVAPPSGAAGPLP